MDTARSPRALVLGATSLVADRLLPRLVESGFEVEAVSRRAPPTRPVGVQWRAGDLAGDWALEGDWPVVFHLAPLWLLPPLVPRLARRGLRRLVAFGSTSRVTRLHSARPEDRDLARRLAEAEAEVARAGGEHHVRWTLFRPTLIYGGGRDKNVSAMGGFARRFGFVPVAGCARGRRQPVRAEDLAEACLAVLDNPATFERAYDLPGGETLTMHEMAERIALHVLGRRRVVRVPTLALRALIAIASWLPAFSHLNPEMARRMSEDLVFDDSDARRDFGWEPSRFDPSGGGRRC